MRRAQLSIGVRAAAARGWQTDRRADAAFVVLLGGLHDGAHAAQVAERVLTSAFNAPVTFEDSTFRVSAKAGVAVYPAHGYDAPTLFRNAEAAREMAAASPEPFLIYAPDMHAELSR